ncbi:MAG: ABC transporter ATP-binding protein [Nocardioides sp.]
MAVAVRDLTVRYGAKLALDSLSLVIPAASITVLLGPNGAGKSTLLEVCEGLRRPTRGTVRVLGLDPGADSVDLLPRLGVQLQSGGVWAAARAEEMLRHLAALHANPLPVEFLVDALGLDSCGRTPYRRLSGGQQQRLGLAMALVGRPEVVVLDEPTAGMDAHIRLGTWDLLRALRDDGVTVIVTTHHLDEAERLADLVHILDRGRLVGSGSPAELRASGESLEQLFLRLTRPRPGVA